MITEIIRVLIADDHQIVRKAIRVLLSHFDDIELVGEARDGWEAVDLYKKLKPDIVLMDLVMPELGGIEATSLIMAKYPEARILLLTSFIYDEYLLPAIKAGAQGCLLKDTDPKDLVQSIRRVYCRQLSLDAKIARGILLEDPAQYELTEREIEVVTLISKGLEGKQIAYQLSLDYWAVTAYINNILDKLHLSNRAQPSFFSLPMDKVLFDVEQKY